MHVTDLATFIRGIPKAELHLHIEGSLEPEQMFGFGKRNKVDLPFQSVEEVRAAYAFSNLQDFLDICYQGASVLMTEDDFREMALAYFGRLRAMAAGTPKSSSIPSSTPIAACLSPSPSTA